MSHDARHNNLNLRHDHKVTLNSDPAGSIQTRRVGDGCELKRASSAEGP